MDKTDLVSGNEGHDAKKTVRTIRLRTFYLILTAVVTVIGAFFYTLYEQGVLNNSLPLISGIQRPRFLFNIDGALGVKLVKPMAVNFDERAQLIYISNTEGHSVDVFKAQGEFLFSFGGFGPEVGRMSYPYGAARTPRGDLLVAEAGNRRIQRFSAKGEFLGTLLDQPNIYGIEKPGPLFIDTKGNIYIGDLSGRKVVVLDEQGKVQRFFGPVDYPHGIAVDEKNRLVYIASSGTREVKVYQLDRESKDPVRSITGFQAGNEQKVFSLVRGIAVDKFGRLLVVDSLAGSVNVFDAQGNYQFSFGSMGYDNGNMLYPNGIATDNNGRIYIADWANNRVVVWGY